MKHGDVECSRTRWEVEGGVELVVSFRRKGERAGKGGALSFHAPLGRGYSRCESVDFEIGELLKEEEEEEEK